MSLREQWIRPLDALPLDYQHVIAITSSGQEEEMYLIDDKWHIVDGVRIPIEFVVFWHEKREQPTVEMAEDCVKRDELLKEVMARIEYLYDVKDIKDHVREVIETAPSVQPQPKRGKWEDCSNGWMCSNCYRDVTYESDFCPNCGCRMDADMREVQDER